MPLVEVNGKACTGCGVCVETCPTDVLRLDAQEKAFMAFPDDCQGCFVCQWDCAYGAVRVHVNGPPSSTPDSP